MTLIVKNKKALFDYDVLEKFEAGIVLTGPEVKSAKRGQVNLTGSYVVQKGGELWLLNGHVAPYRMALQSFYDPTRDRKLLLKKHQVATLIGKIHAKGLTVLPLSVYTKGGFVKIEVGVCRGRRQFDKRQILKKRETDRAIRRIMRGKT